MKKDFWKKLLPYIASISIFAVISIGYFTPDIFEGKTLFQDDMKQGFSVGAEGKVFYEKTGERTRWTNSLFSGMPNYQISPGYDSMYAFRSIVRVYDLYIPYPAGLIFIMLLGFFILLKALNIRTPLAVAGAIFYAFSSYFFIIITAGHIWKFVTLAYIPPTIGGIILIYKGRYWLGGIVTATFTALQITSNHIQMSYYFGFVIIAYLIAVFVDAIINKQLFGFLKSSAVLLVAVAIGACINISNLYHTYEYSKQTIRGPSELTHNIENQTSDGLERDYIVQWSYGTGETWSLLIPNVKGGASGALGYSRDKNSGEWKRDKAKNKEALDRVDSRYREQVAQQNTYWGNQPGTSGPVYVGAFVFALAVLGLFIIKNRLKWFLLGVTILSILLSWGQNFMGFTDFFLDYVPMYNKFRAVSSILVIAEFTIPLMAVLTLKEIIDNPGIFKEKKVLFWVGIGSIGFITFVLALMPGTFFDFLSKGDLAQKAAYINRVSENAGLTDQQKYDQIAQIEMFFQEMFRHVQDVRIDIFRSDAWRSFFIIVVGTGFLLLFSRKKVTSTVLIACLTVLCFFDMASVNKRYLSSDNFVSKSKIKEPPYGKPTVADQLILQDTTLYYRVLNGSVDYFNDASTSFFHKSIGGYHAAKLRRYQELKDHHLNKELMQNIGKARTMEEILSAFSECNVLNMLNMHYFIYHPEQYPMKNPYACGNAWFVDEIQQVDNADEEIAALNDFNPLHTAIVDKRFEKDLPKEQITPKDSLSSIVLTEYAPNKLTFKVQAKKDEFAVFSDIWYPGWKAEINGKEYPIVRANYVLRAMQIPQGDHTIVFTFDPKTIHTTETIAYIALILLVLGSIGYVGFRVYKYVKNE